MPRDDPHPDDDGRVLLMTLAQMPILVLSELIISIEKAAKRAGYTDVGLGPGMQVTAKPPKPRAI